MKTNGAIRVDYHLKDDTSLLEVMTNILYHHAMTSFSRLSPEVENMWNACKSNARWWDIYCNVVVIPLCYFVQMGSYGES